MTRGGIAFSPTYEVAGVVPGGLRRHVIIGRWRHRGAEGMRPQDASRHVENGVECRLETRRSD